MGEQIDQVIMGLGRPGTGGRAALKSPLEINPSAKIIVASGYAADDEVKAAWETGGGGYVPKPFKAA